MPRKMFECPRCGLIVQEFPALSRRDNQTDICSACGTEEALVDAKLASIDAMVRDMKFVKRLKRQGKSR